MPHEQNKMVFTDMLVVVPTVLDSKENNDGKMRVRFKATQANVLNTNQRIYPYNVLNDAVDVTQDAVKGNRMIGESPHPKHGVSKNGKVVFDTSIDNSVIKIYKHFMEDGIVYVDAEVLDTAKGKDLKALIAAGVPVGISMRALGDSVKKQIGNVMVDVATKLDIQSYDVVMNPATDGCEVVQVLTDSEMAEVMSDDVQITTPNCPDCGGQLTPQDPDNDGDLDFYSCVSCGEVWVPSNSKTVQTYASQSLSKIPNDPDYDGYYLARKWKAAQNGATYTDSKMSSKTRDNLVDDEFAVPSKRKLPINDVTHVKLAWDMVNKTKGLTAEEKSEAKKRIKAKAKKLDVDTSAWKDSIEEDDEMPDIKDLLAAMKDSPEFKSIIEEAANAKVKPLLDAQQAQADEKARQEALVQAKAETKAFVDGKISELKGKVADEVLNVVLDSVKDVADKGAAEVIIDSFINIYSKTVSEQKVQGMGITDTALLNQLDGGQTRVQVGHEHSPWEKSVQSMLDSFDKVAMEQGHQYDPSIRKVNKPVVDEIMKAFVDKVGNEAMNDSVTFMDSVMTDAASLSVTTAQLLNQPTIQQALLIQAFQDVESLQFMIAETFEGSEVRWPVETFTSAATINPATGVADLLVGEGAGIPESEINLAWLSFNPSWRRNAISLSTDVVNVLKSGPAKYDAIARGLYHIAFDKRRKLDSLAYLEMAMAADEYQPTVVAGESGVAGDYAAGATGSNVSFVYKVSVKGAANGTRGTNPIVRPRTKSQILPSGQTQSVTTNPVSVTVGGTAKTMGYLDSSGNIQGGDYAVDFENGIFYFAASAGINTTTPTLPVINYSAVTNYDRWSFTVPNGINADQYYNTLLQKITGQVALMGSAPRYQRPNLGIMSLNTATYIENAAMWYKLNSPDLGSLSGLADSTFFGSRSGVNFARINAPTVFGDNRIILTQKGATRYAVETAYQIEGPFPKYDQATGNIVDAKVFYGRENSVLATPQTIDSNGNILNPKLRSLKITQ